MVPRLGIKGRLCFRREIGPGFEKGGSKHLGYYFGFLVILS